MASVEIRNIYKSFGPVEVIHGIDVEIADKELVVLVGPSGCGKSTLLRMIAGLEDITAGEIAIDDKVVNRVAAKERNIAMVFQSYALYPHMTVYRNMSFGLRMRKIPKDEQDRRIRWAAEVLELTDYLKRYPRQLSGGQRQRVAMGRALVREPIVFLFDEPLSNLDAQLRVQMRTEIRELHQRLQTTMIYVTHDQVEAMTLADRIVVMRDGYIEQIGAPAHVYDRPANTFVAGFIGSPQMNMLPGTLGPDGTIALDGGVTARHDQDIAAQAGRSVLYGIRPEDLRMVGEGEGFPLTLDVVETTGREIELFGSLGARRICVLLQARASVRPGETVWISPDPARAHIFDAESGARLLAPRTARTTPPARPEADRPWRRAPPTTTPTSSSSAPAPAASFRPWCWRGRASGSSAWSRARGSRRASAPITAATGNGAAPPTGPSPSTCAHPHDYPVDSTDETTLMWNGVGGSTGIYTATWPRYRPSDFRKGTEHGLAPDWPISYEDLAPYFEMADEACGVSGWAGDPAMPPRGPFQTRPGPRGAMGEVVSRGFDALGWHWWPMPCAILGEGYDGRLACNNCGACQSGCPRGSLNDMAVTHWPKALAAGVELRTDSRVERIETDAAGRATGVVYVERNTGVRRLQTADVVILAANGVGTPRLLLLSESAAHPQRARQPLRPGGPQPHAPHAGHGGVLGRRADRIAQGPDLRHRHLRGVRGERHGAGLRQRPHAPRRAPERRGLPGARLPLRQRRPLGRGAPRLVRPPLRPRHRHPHRGRRPAAP